MSVTGIIGGSGLDKLDGLAIIRRTQVETPYGEPSSALTFGSYAGEQVIFIARHGDDHSILPHNINYCANLAALQQAGATQVIAVCAVGGIRDDMSPGVISIPGQLIDYTHSRQHTIFANARDLAAHIDFTEPYCESLRQQLITAAAQAGITASSDVTYGATQGPRLETAAEINRMDRDGCHVVGMTGMPEASIARELGLCYAVIALSANFAAGREAGPIDIQTIETTLNAAMGGVRSILAAALTLSHD